MNTRAERALAVFEQVEELGMNDHGSGATIAIIQLRGWGELMTKGLPLLHRMEVVPVQLHDLYGSLINPLLEMNGDISDTICIQVAPFGSALATLAQAMVDYAYSLRFCKDNLEHFQDGGANSHLIVAVDAQLPHVVWGTLRIAWGPGIDVFELFSIRSQEQDPTSHHRGKVGSFGRMAVHPIFDNLGFVKTPNDLAFFNAARIELARGLMHAGLAVLKDKSLDHVYFIASEARHLWLSMCGVQSERIEDAMVAETLTVADLRQRYPRYWQDKPRLFELTDWEIAAL